MGKVVYADVRRKFDLDNVNLSLLDSLPNGSISLAATVQYLNLIPFVKSHLEKKQRKVILKKGAFYDAQVLGCNISAFDKNCDIFVLLCDGLFHALNNAILMNKEIYVFNGEKIDLVNQEEIENYLKRLKAKKKKFLDARSIGILVSNKPGQNFSNVLTLKKRLIKVDKKVYIFSSDNIDINDFENYPDIPIYINSACPGLARDDKRIINLSDILEFLR